MTLVISEQQIITCNSPRCNKEFGPGTEYDRRGVVAEPHRRAVLRGSILCNVDLTLSRVTQIPLLLKLLSRQNMDSHFEAVE